jgi:hypothetical protein
MSIEADVTRSVLMYFVLPLWLVAGFADYLCHRATNISTTSGPKESLIHLAMLGEAGIAVTAAMALEINALVIVLMMACWAAHEVTAVWDVVYAHDKREIRPVEQWVHSYLGVLPLMSLVLVVVLNWGQFLALLGLGTQAARFDIAMKDPPLAWSYVLPMMAAVALLEVLPYLEELIRGLRANRGSLEPQRRATAASPVVGSGAGDPPVRA